MKVLVTGNAGFIGFHVARRLLERGEDVVGIDAVNVREGVREFVRWYREYYCI